MKKIISKKWLLLAISFFVGVLIVMFFTSDVRSYSKAQKLFAEGDYQKASEIFFNLGDYKNSVDLAAISETKAIYVKADNCFEEEDYENASELYHQILEYEDAAEKADMSEHLLKVKKDTIPPTVTGLKQNESIPVVCGTDFNLKEFLENKVEITDNVSGMIEEYKVHVKKNIVDSVTNEPVYDEHSGKLETIVSGNITLSLSTEDEAGNETEIPFSIELVPIRLTKENPKPMVYDGEYGLVQVQSFEHGYIFGQNQFVITFYVENKTEGQLIVHLPSNGTFIDNYQIQSRYYLPGDVSAGKRGTAKCSINDEDIPEELSGFQQIETMVCFREKSIDEHSFYRIPMIIDVDAVNIN